MPFDQRKKGRKIRPYFSDDHENKRVKQANNSWKRRKQNEDGDENVKSHKRKKEFRNTDSSHTYHPQCKNRMINNLEEDNIYFSCVLRTYENGFEDEEKKEIFLQIFFEEAINREVELSCQNIASRCIELLLQNCKNLDIIIRFMKAFLENIDTVLMDRNASHISQQLLYTGLTVLMDSELVAKTSTDTEEIQLFKESEHYSFMLSWICSFAEYCCNNFFKFIDHEYANHVLRTLIQVLGHYFIDKKVLQSKRLQHEKEKAPGKNNDSAVISKEETSRVPKIFLKLLKNISKQVLRNENIKDFFHESLTTSVIQILLLVTKKRLSKYCSKLVKFLCSEIFSNVNNQSIPSALIKKNSSYIAEKVFEVADVEQQHFIWTQMKQYLDSLVQHQIGNLVIQKCFDVVKDKKLFEIMSEETTVHFEKIFEKQKFGIWHSMAKACNRVNAQQALFMKSIMECLNCYLPEDRRVYIAPLVVSLHKFSSQDNEQTIQLLQSTIKLQGSLLLQEVLKFRKPIKVVTSIINMKLKELEILACHVQGCHVFTSFFESLYVGEKNRDKLIQKLKPAILSIAMHVDGSFTLSKIWLLASLKQRCIIADVLSKNRELLSQHKNAFILLKKCAIFHYEHNLEKWKLMQNRLLKKRHFLREITGD